MFRNLGIEFLEEDGSWKHASCHHRLSFLQCQKESLLIQPELPVFPIELHEKSHLSEIEQSQSYGFLHDWP